jgi:hypothetical protein
MNCFYISRPSKVARDFIVDVLENFWKSQRQQFAQIQTLVINQDNGAENHSLRTLFMQRIREFSQKLKLNVRLAYYPPERSKYNPVEQTWGI